jgi:methyltransferase (TIGR00027 family)
MRIVSLPIFVVLQLVMLPLALVGVCWVAWRQIGVSRALGVSHTGIEILNGRWTAHVFGLREDAAAADLAAALPNTSTRGLWLVLFPLWVQARISGRPLGYPRIPEPGREAMADLVVGRSVFIDRFLDEAIEAGDQVVVLGAGYDTRAQGPLGARAGAWFEVDQEATQRLKRQGLERAGIDASHVRFVTVDFRTDDLFEQLAADGFDPSRRAHFLWEGVTLYLSEKDVRRTLSEIRARMQPGCVLVLDLYGERMLAMARKGATRKALDTTGEGMQFVIDLRRTPSPEVEALLRAHGWAIAEARYLGASHRDGAFAVVVAAIPDEDADRLPGA